MIRIAGTVVLYNPTVNFIENIKSYLGQIDILFAIDNSDFIPTAFVDLINSLPKVVYVRNGANVGIAKALNIAALMAIERKFDFLLMMDQDSHLSNNCIQLFKEYLTHDSEAIGILYAFHKYQNITQPLPRHEHNDLLIADTAGSLLNLSAFQRVGGFIDELFIDFVDFEYCLRLRQYGYRIVQISSGMLWQPLGRMTARKFLFWEIGISNHSPERIYYRTRNRLFVSAKYFTQHPLWAIHQTLYIVVDGAKILLFESEKSKKLKMILLGISHFFSNTYGQIRS